MQMTRYNTMVTRTFLLGAISAVAVSMTAPAMAYTQTTGIDDAVDHALVLAGQEDYRAALAALDGLGADRQASYETRFARARILSWSGRYQEAEKEFTALLTDYPDDPDVLLAYGYLAYYQGDRQHARQRFSRILATYPDYEDARLGLERAYRIATLPDLENRGHRFRLDTGLEVSSFSRSDNDDWQQYFLSAAFIGETRSLALSYDRFERFSLDDDQYAARYSQQLGNGWDSSVQFAYVPDADFRPETSIDLEMGKTFKLGDKSLAALRPFLGFRHDVYTTDDIDSITPGLEAYFQNGAYARASLISVTPEGDDRKYGFVGRVTWPVGSKVKLTVGAADAPEAIAAIVVRTRSVFASFDYELTDDVAIRIGASRDDREDSYIRESLNASLTHSF